MNCIRLSVVNQPISDFHFHSGIDNFSGLKEFSECMIGAINGLGQLGYGAIYAIPLAYMYAVSGAQTVTVPLYGRFTPGLYLSVCLVAASIYSAIWFHHVGKLIFGDHSGLRSSKSNSVALKHLILFSTGVPPSEVENINLSVDLLEKIVESNEFESKRLLWAIPGALIYLHLIISWFWVGLLLFQNRLDILVGILWLALTILLFKDWVTKPLPDVVSPDEVDNIETPEYVVARERIRKKDSPEGEPRLNRET